MKSLKLRPWKPPIGHRIAGRAQLDHILDPYARHEKLSEGATCPKCGAVFHDGRWEWWTGPRPEGAAEEQCAACRRIEESFPAGVVTLRGAFVQQHKDELIQMARHQEELEKKEHPMNRIMSVEANADGVTITTTDIHLPRRIGETIKRAWRGKLTADFEEEGYFVRVNWTRES
jgi:hypothetical protein